MANATIRVMCSDCRNHGAGTEVVQAGEYIIATPGAYAGAKESLEIFAKALGEIDTIVFSPHTDCAGEKVTLEEPKRNCAHMQLSDLIPWCKKELPNTKLKLEFVVLDGSETSLDLADAEVLREFGEWKVYGVELGSG